MKRFRVLTLVNANLVPPDTMEGKSDREIDEWKTEFDVVSTLREMGHDVDTAQTGNHRLEAAGGFQSARRV
jgi:hypothetical protein